MPGTVFWLGQEGIKLLEIVYQRCFGCKENSKGDLQAGLQKDLGCSYLRHMA